MALFLDAGSSSYKSDAIKVVKSTDLNQEASTPVLDVVPAPPATDPFQKLQAVVNTSTAVGGDNGVKVQMWAQALGVGNSPYIESFGGTAGVEIPAGAGLAMTANTPLVFSRDWDQTHGLGTVATNPANQPAVDQINALLAGGTEFHCCIKANVFAINNNTDAVVEGQRLPASPTLNFSDPRQAQRNMTIKTHATGTAMAMMMFAGNTGDDEQDVQLLLVDRPLKGLPRPEFAELAAAAPWIRTTRKRYGRGFVPGLEVVVKDKRFPIRFAERPLDDIALEIEGEQGAKIDIVLPPEKPVRMVMHVGVEKEDFVLRSLNVAQIERERVVGEAHVLLLSAPEELAKTPPRFGKAA
jgi:hypothetical protein